MMRIVPALALALLAPLALPIPSEAQSLGELAAREKEKRKAKASTTKSYGDEDLAGRSTGVSETSEPAAESPAQASQGSAQPEGAASKKEKTEDEIRAEKEKAWRDRLAKANEELGQMGARIEALQRALGDISQQIYGSTRTAQLTELEKLQKDQAQKTQEIADLEEEGRRSGWRP